MLILLAFAITAFVLWVNWDRRRIEEAADTDVTAENIIENAKKKAAEKIDR